MPGDSFDVESPSPDVEAEAFTDNPLAAGLQNDTAIKPEPAAASQAAAARVYRPDFSQNFSPEQAADLEGLVSALQSQSSALEDAVLRVMSGLVEAPPNWQ